MRGQRALPGLTTPGRGPRCRTCLQPIRFVTLDGQRVPVDRNPSELRGTIRIRKGGARLLSTSDARIARARNVPLFVPHRESCFDQGRWAGTSIRGGRMPDADDPAQGVLDEVFQ